MDIYKRDTYRWFVEWLPELSIVEVSVEIRYNPIHCADILDELGEQRLVVARNVKESILKEICKDSIKAKMNHGDHVRFPMRFGFFNADTDANWAINVTAVNRGDASAVTHIDNWENDFYKTFWTDVTSK